MPGSFPGSPYKGKIVTEKNKSEEKLPKPHLATCMQTQLFLLLSSPDPSSFHGCSSRPEGAGAEGSSLLGELPTLSGSEALG